MVEGPKGGNIKKMTNPAKNIAFTFTKCLIWAWLIKCEKKSKRQQNGAVELVRAFYPGWCSSSCQSLLSSATYLTSPPPRSPTLSGSQSQPFHPLLRQRGRFSPGLWLAWWRYSINNGGQSADCLYTGGKGRDWLSLAQSHTLLHPAWIRPHSRIPVIALLWSDSPPFSFNSSIQLSNHIRA